MFKIQKLDLLISLYIFCIASAELMGAKTFPLFNIGDFKVHASVAIFVFPLTFLINDIVTEVFGREKARSIIRSGLIVIALILLFSLVSTSLPPSQRFLSSEASYDNVFHKSARFAAASLLAFLISELLDVQIFTKIRDRFGKKALWFRANASNILSQLVDATIFMTLAFYALSSSMTENASFILSLLIPYFLIRVAISVLETPLVYLGVSWLKKDK